MSGYSVRIDMTGQRFGKWYVLGFSHIQHHQAYWLCRCDCGNEVPVSGRSLRRGLSKGCELHKIDKAQGVRTIRHEIIDGIECKRCRLCKEWRPLGEFSKSKERWDGLDKDCKQCLSAERAARREKRRPYMRGWANNKYATDIKFRIKSAIQARIRAAIKNNYKAAGTTELIGCSIEYLKCYLEFQFKDGMSWDNYGEWHVDHRIPCASFDLSDPEQQKACFHYTNLQPLWWIDNVRKGARMP